MINASGDDFPSSPELSSQNSRGDRKSPLEEAGKYFYKMLIINKLNHYGC